MKVINTPIASYEIHGNVVVGIYNEGVNVDEAEIPLFVEMINENISGDFAFITDNQNSYSVNPTIPIETCKQLPNLKLFANVTHFNKVKDAIYLLEHTFPKYVKLNKFETLDEAFEWVRDGLGS